jgi:thiosulfate/3-mercaptopyruvate sulfurtransferase
MTSMTGPLISASQLSGWLDRVTVLDVRYRLGGPPGYDEFLKGHIPGAAYVDLDTALAAPPGRRGRHPLPDPDVYVEAMRAAGVSGSRPVVVYDDWGGRAAARAWWMLRYHGHPEVYVMDGGWSGWRKEGGEVESGIGATDQGDFMSRPGGMPVVEADGVLDVDVLVDARAPERYRGEVEPIDPVAGHIPGAVNVPTESNLALEGRFRRPNSLRATYAEVGATADADVAVYCGSGVTAAHDVLAMEIAGIRAALYPGSWSEWVTDPSRPVER